MANTPKAFFRGAATTNTSTTLYTVPSNTTAIVTNIVVDNTSGSAQTFTINIDGVAMLSSAPLSANASAFFDLKQVVPTTKIISGGASATSVTFHISGMEVS